MDKIWVLLEFFMCSIEVGLVYIFCLKFLELNRSRRWYCRLIVGGIASFIIFLATYYKINSLYRSILGLVVLFLFIEIFFYKQQRNKIIYFILFYFLLGLSDFIATWILSMVQNESLFNIIEIQGINRLVTFAISKIIFILVFTIIAYYKTIEKGFLPRGFWILFLFLFSMLMIAVIVIADIGLPETTVKYFNEFLLIVIIILLTVYFAIYFLFYEVCKYFTKMNEMSLMKYQYETFEKYLSEKEISNEILKELEHDLKHHLLYWKELSEKKENFALAAELSQYEQKLNNNLFLELGDRAANVIINEKLIVARNNSTLFEVKGCFDQGLIVTSTDMCSLLGNILDNALEAALKIKDVESRRIMMSIKKDGRLTYLEIKNSYEEEPVMKNNIFLSTKKNRINHGIGMDSIKKIVEKYDGAIKYSFKDHEFSIFIMLVAYDK